MKKRILSLAVAVLMIFSLFPTTASAADVGTGSITTVVMDGGDTDGHDYQNCAYVHADANGGGLVYETHADDHGDVVAVHYINGSGTSRGGIASVEQVDASTGMVHSGDKALRLNYDFRNINGIEGACFGFDHDIVIDGNPCEIGLWVYAPENTPNLWLRVRLRGGDGAIRTLNFTTQSQNVGTDGDNTLLKEWNLGTKGGINWVGWKYVSCDLSSVPGPITLMAGETIRILDTNGGQGDMGRWVCQKDETGTIVYGPTFLGNPDDQSDIAVGHQQGVLYFDDLCVITEHEHVTELRGAVEPTETEPGYTGDLVCTICGEIVEQGEEIPATGPSIVASGDCGDHLTWTLDSNGVLTLSGYGEMTSSPWRKDARRDAVRSVVFDGDVATLCDSAFEECSNLTSIELPDSVSAVGYYAFRDCTGLTSAVIPASLENVGYEMFRGCTSLTSVALSDGIRSIGNAAFFDCTSLASVDLPDGLRAISSSAFAGCTSLASVDLPDGLESISDSAFSNCVRLTSIELPDSVYYVGNSAFYGCTSLTSIELPDSVKRINDRTFWNCTSLASIALPDGLEYIGSGAFQNCTSLTSVEFPDSLGHINESAFRGCASLTSVELPDSLYNLYDYAFADCVNLRTVRFPARPVDLRSNAFNGCAALTEAELTCEGALPGYAFMNCTSLEKLVLRGGSEIRSYALGGCTALREVHLPASLRTLKANAFRGSDAITDVYYGGCSETLWSGVERNDTGNESLLNAAWHYAEHETERHDVREATCTQEGYTGDLVCAICGETIESGEIIPMTDHQLVRGDHWDATCTQEGWTGDLHCEICGLVVEQGETIPMTDHVAGWRGESREPTCTEEGWTGDLYCQVCGEVMEPGETIPMTDHETELRNVREATCSQEGYTGDLVCTVCDKTVQYGESIPALAHQTELRNVQEATCTGWGWSGDEVCTVCGRTVSEGHMTEPLGHQTEVQGYRAPTDDEEGYTGDLVCTRCGETVDYGSAIPALRISGTCGDHLTWTLDSNGVLTIRGYGEMTWSPWRENEVWRDAVRSVVFDGDAATLCDYAFEGCRNLTSIALPDSVSAVGSYAFANCTSLTSAVIPASLETISYRMFSGCTSLSSVELPDGLLRIDSDAFLGCTSLTSLELPDSVAAIGNCSFMDCTSLETIEFSDDLRMIDGDAFHGCASLTSVELPDSLYQLYDYAFADCVNLRTVRFPAREIYVGPNAFNGCTALTEAELTCGELQSYAFMNCTSLEKLVLRGGTEISSYALGGCTALREVHLPASLRTLKVNAFRGANAITDVYYGGCSETLWSSVERNEIGNESLLNAAWHYAEHETERRDARESTCAQEGYTGDLVCTVCGDVVEAGETIPMTDHETELRNVREATCSQEGWTGDLVCIHCGETVQYGESIPALPHQIELRNVQEPTCEGWGYTGDEVCSVCGRTVKQGYMTEPLGHQTELRDCREATCTECGYSGDWWCTRCGELVEQGYTTPNYMHETELRDYREPTHHEPGYSGDWWCTRCGEMVQPGEELPATWTGACGDNLTWYLSDDGVLTIRGEGAMSWAPWQNDWEALNTIQTVCIDEGVTHLSENAFMNCRNLSEIFFGGSRSAWEDAASQAVDTIAKGAHVHDLAASPDGHFYTATVSATCETEGYTVRTCDCGYEYDRVVTEPALGHDWSDWVTILEPTPEKNGVAMRVCATDESHVEFKVLRYSGFEITLQPEDQTAPIGSSVVFTVGAVGDDLTYQWQYRVAGKTTWYDSTMPGADTATLTVPVTAKRDGQSYRCVVRNAQGERAASAAATLTVGVPQPMITILSHPQDVFGRNGEMVTFFVEAQGDGLQYQWQYAQPGKDAWYNSSAAGAKTDTLTIQASAKRDGQRYRCVITDAVGNQVISEPATLYLAPDAEPFAIVSQPADQTVPVGTNAVFAVQATGEGLTYQWQYCSVGKTTWYKSTAAGATTDTLTISATAKRDGQRYRCVITDAQGNQLISDPATLHIG